MTRLQFEKSSASQLNSYATSFDLERMWANIDSELRPERKPIAWLPWALGVAGMALLLAYFVAFEQSSNQNPKPDTAIVTPIAVEQKAETSTDSPLISTKNCIKQSNTAIDASNRYATSAEVETIENLNATNMRPLPRSTNLNVSNTVIFADKNGNAHADGQTMVKGEETRAFEISTTIEQKALNDQPSRTKFNLPTSEPAESPSVFSKKEKIQSLVLLPTTTIAALKNQRIYELPEAFDKSPDLGCYSFGKKNSLKPYLNIYGGYQRPLRSLKAESAASESLANLRKDTEKVLEGLLVGVQLGMILPSGLFFEAGGEYQRINEKFQYTTTSVDTVGKTLMAGFILNAPGDTTFFQDSVFVINETVSDRKTYNKYNFIQIPIDIGYEFRTGSRWSPYVRAGAMINVLFKHKAEQMVTATSSVLYESNNSRSDDPFRAKIGVSPFVSAGMRFQKSDWLAFFGEIRYQHPLKTVTITESPVAQKYKLPSINLGVRMFKPIAYD